MGSPKLLRNMFYYNAKKSALEQIFLLMVIIGKARAAIWQINRATLAKTVVMNGCLHRMVILMRINAKIRNLLQAKVKTLVSQTLDLSI